MNIIYLHGFQSSALSIKAQQLKQYIGQQPVYTLHVPDLNLPPQQVLADLCHLIEQLHDVVLVGSSLGGFYATQLVAKYGMPAVLINPAMRPWQLFQDLFGLEQMPYPVNPYWTLDQLQLEHLAQMAVPFVQDADKILLLLQQGDEVLDYREAERYYSAAQHRALIMLEPHGNHAIDNFADKIPMILEFLSSSLK